MNVTAKPIEFESRASYRVAACTEAARFAGGLLAVVISLTLVWLLFSRLVVPEIIERLYRGDSLPFLGNLMSARRTLPLEDYLVRWQATSWTIAGLMTLVGLIPLPLAATGPAMQRYIQNCLGWAGFRPLPLTTLLALGFFGFIHYLFYFAPVGFVYLVVEDSWAEFGSVVAWAMAFSFLTWALIKDRSLRRLGLFALTASALFIAIEEMSWGQRIVGIRTPEAFARHNIQQEFNLHNFVPMHEQVYAILAAVIIAWSIALPLLAKRWKWLGVWCERLGIPIVPAYVRPFFMFAALHIWTPSHLYVPDLNAEIGEMLFGIAVATLALGIVLSATSGEQRPGATASLPIIAMILIGGIFTAVFVNSYRGYGNLRQHLNRRAANDLPSLGMHRQALMLFDYIHNNPHLSRPETRFRHALLLMKLDGNGKARPLLELVAAEQERLANEQPEDPEPFRVKGHALSLLERREEANASFTKAIENDRNLLSSTDNLQSRARIHFSLAKTFHAMGDFARAKEQISEARRLRSDRMLPMLIDRWLSEENVPWKQTSY